MKTEKEVPSTIEAYIAGFPPEIRDILERVRSTIREAAPEAEESISYQMPTFKQHGKPLIYFSANKKHIGLYPVPLGHAAFRDDAVLYGSGKGTMQFPYNKPIPYDLISRIVQFNMLKNDKRSPSKTINRKSEL